MKLKQHDYFYDWLGRYKKVERRGQRDRKKEETSRWSERIKVKCIDLWVEGDLVLLLPDPAPDPLETRCFLDSSRM